MNVVKCMERTAVVAVWLLLLLLGCQQCLCSAAQAIFRTTTTVLKNTRENAKTAIDFTARKWRHVSASVCVYL